MSSVAANSSDSPNAIGWVDPSTFPAALRRAEVK
jgi:hypothetical protein